ncbi:MAG TPA: hypothetical protein VJO99_20270 [Burkholderiaceae bacterium]|nr:hypothetical protein [Burkholderiaceae bacterium]
MRRGAYAALAVVAVACLLAACGEKPQTLSAASKKPDAAPWAPSSGASSPFFASGWKGGDQAAWEAQIRTRNQGQNDYAR